MSGAKPKITCTEYVQLTYENFCKDKRAVRSGVIEIEYENLSADEKASLLAHSPYHRIHRGGHSMIKTIRDYFLGLSGGPAAKDERIEHSHFSEFLPWLAYSQENALYYLRDNAACWIFECSPMVLATPDTFKSLSDMYKISLPEGSIMQFMLYADPYVEHLLDHFEALRDKNPTISPVLRRQAKNYRKFLSNGTKGLKQLQGTPLKNFRLFFSVRVPIDANFATNQDAWLEEALESQNFINNCTEVLKGAGMGRSQANK